MASRRNSGRRGKSSKGIFVIAAAVILAGAGGGYVAFGGNKAAATEGAIAELIPGIKNDGQAASEDPAADAKSLAEVEDQIAQANAALNSPAEVRDASMKASYASLSKLLEGPLPYEARERALTAFHSITGELFLSPVHNEFSESYTVKPGDNYERIAGKAGISLNLLYDLNKKPRGTRNLQAGENLKLPKGKVTVVVRKRDYTTSLYFGDNLVRQYIVAHGANDNTPLGITQISTMSVDPEKQSRGPNDPVNEMHLRWIGLQSFDDARTKEVESRSGFGLHGTQHPESIPGMTSRGCIRMKDADVVELYDIVRIGNRVEIKA